MFDSREVPSGRVYRQLFDAQVQLSRSLLAGRKDTTTDCLSADHSNTHCSTASRLCLSSWGQQVEDEDDDDDVGVDDVIRLPDTVVVNSQRSDIIERLMQKKSKKHKDALKELDAELTALTQVCETQVRTASAELLSSLQDTNLRLDTLKGRMEQLEDVSLQEVCGLWEEVEEEVKLRRTRIMELKQKLTESETQRSNKLRAVLRTYCHLLEKISFQLPAEIHRLIHSEAMMMNQCLLANRRSIARLLLLLQEENLQQESLLRLHWENSLSRWRRTRVSHILDKFRSQCGQDVEQQLVVEQELVQEMREAQDQLTQQRCDIICKISSLVPPSCSTALISDWFNQLTDVNKQIDTLHTDFLQQLRCRCEQAWQDRLEEVQRCEEALSALQLSEEEVADIVSSQLLTLIGQNQKQEEERLAALDLWSECVSCAATSLSRCVFVVMRAAALLWETHRRKVERREEEVQRHLDELRHSQEQHIQKVRLDDLLGGLRQESSEDALKTTLDRTVNYLQDVKESCSVRVSEQLKVLDRFPSLFLEELHSYSSSLSSFYRLSSVYTPSPEELQNLLQLSSNSNNSNNSNNNLDFSLDVPPSPGLASASGSQLSVPASPESSWTVVRKKRLFRRKTDAELALAEAESSMLELCDVNTLVMFTSSRGVAYTGPAFGCPAPDLPDNLQQHTHLNLFPVELLTHTLSRTRTLFLDHLEQRFCDLDSVVTMITDKKEVVCLDQELQLQQLDPQNIHTHIYLPRLAELQFHRQCVDNHCQLLLDVLASCRSELQRLQTSIGEKNQDFIATLSNMEDDVLAADCSRSLEAISSTLQDCVDRHIKQTQCSQTSFRQMVQVQLEDLRHRTSRLLDSFRLFSEGGDFAPQEVKMFQRRLKEETKQLSVTEESVYSQLETFQSNSLQQVNEASAQFREKLSVLQSEMKFSEEIQRIISSTQVQIKAEAAGSNRQQSGISSRLEDLRKMMENTQVSADQVCLLLSSVQEELKKRFRYLEFSLENFLTARPKSRKQALIAPTPGLLQPCRPGVDFLDDPAVGVVKALNRRFIPREVSAEKEQRGGTAVGHRTAGQSPVQRQQKRTDSARSIRMERKFQIFGTKAEDSEKTLNCFSSIINLLLWKANNVLLLVAEEFYQRERCVLHKFRLVPDSLDQWAESTQQRLLGYQEQARRLLSKSREELVRQLSELEKMLLSLPSVLIRNYELQQEAGLREEVGGAREKLEQTMAASEREKTLNVQRLRASLSEVELSSLAGREELRQQQLHDAVLRSHLDLQEHLRVRGEEFVTSLAALAENLLRQMDHLTTETEAASHHAEGSGVTMETGPRIWSGIPPDNGSAHSAASVDVATTASITTTRCTMGHLAVIEQRDAAVKRFEESFRSELSHSDSNKQRMLRDLQSWTMHWKQQIHTLKHKKTH